MSEAANRRAVDKLIDGLNGKNIEVMNEVFSDDSEISYPQSGEVICGRANRQAMYAARTALPSITPYRTIASGDIVVTEAILDYGGDRHNTVMIFEFRDDKMVRQTAYWSKPFSAPEWRSRWVEKSIPASS